MAAISTKAGSERLSNLHIFPPHEGIEATSLHHRLLKLEHHIVQHRQLVCCAGARRIEKGMSRNEGIVSSDGGKRGFVGDEYYGFHAAATEPSGTFSYCSPAHTWTVQATDA